ncbi:MAG: hypothetical protein ACOX6V_04895 [Patescibacteria group bacterium]|jgi:hypothetical protein
MAKPSQKKTKKALGMESLRNILLKYDLDDSPRYISKEFQDYGYRLALELGDVKRVSMYIKFAKTIDRSILEVARCFVKDAKNVKNKSRLFMWKLKQLKTPEDKAGDSSLKKTTKLPKDG